MRLNRVAASPAITIVSFGSTALFHCPQHLQARFAGGVRQVEQRLEAVLAAQSDWRVRGVVSDAGGDQQDRASGSDVR